MNSLNLAVFVLLVAFASGQPLAETNSRNNREICAGCAIDVPNQKKINALVKSTLLEFDLRSDLSTKYKLKVIKAQSQVVAGVLYTIKGTLVATNCGKEDLTDVNSCDELEVPKPEVCEIIIWEQSWMPMGRKTEVKCETKEFKFESEVTKMQ